VHRWITLAGVAALVAVTWWFGSAGIELSVGLGVALLFRPVHLGWGIRGLAVAGVTAFLALLGLLDRLMSGGLGSTVVSVLALAVVGFPLTVAGIWLSQVENVQRQRYRDWAAGRVQAQLARGRKPRYSLYLRPFVTQDRMGTAAVGEMIHTPQGQGIVNVQTDMEAILASVFSVRRPLIGAGRDGRLLTAATDQPSGSPAPDIPGVGKFACTEDDWEDKVTQAAENAELIVVVPLAYEGTLWEIDWLSSASLLSRTVFVMPPSRSSGHDYGPEWNRGIDALADLGITVPPYHPEGGTFLYRNADLTTPFSSPVFSGCRLSSAAASFSTI
jgi:hypothetical protein